MAPSTRSDSGLIETHSIDHIPERDRHGKVWHQGPFWFTGNFVLTTMVIGFLGPTLGLNLTWSILSPLLGAAFGTFFMAFHANQGPRLGLPQMIQSRAQFGIKGAILPFTAVIFVYVGFNVFNVILATQGLQTLLPGGKVFWYLTTVILATVIAIIGHDLIHLVQRYLTYFLIASFAAITIYAFTRNGHAHPAGGFSWTAFLTAFSAAAGYQISYAVYVSDYSRYLPSHVSSKKVIWWTYIGACGSAAWLMTLGAVVGHLTPAPDVVDSLRTLGNDLFPGFGTGIVILSSIALISIMSVNAYGAMLTGASAVQAFRKVSPTRGTRVVGVLLTELTVLLIALALPDDYLGSFNTFVLLMLYFLIPWTAINLADFYWIRKGSYNIEAIYDPAGIYGNWSRNGLLSYVAGFLSMVPFFSTSLYTGPIAKSLDGADLSFAVGLVVSAGVYIILTRTRLPAQGKHPLEMVR
nr:cytosine permease [Streptomyces chartreusis]